MQYQDRRLRQGSETMKKREIQPHDYNPKKSLKLLNHIFTKKSDQILETFDFTLSKSSRWGM